MTSQVDFMKPEMNNNYTHIKMLILTKQKKQSAKCKPQQQTEKLNQGCVNLRDALDGSFSKGFVIFDRIKTDFLRQLRLPAAHTLCYRSRKKGEQLW